MADQKIALEQYRNVLGYLQYENTIYWTRSGFMLVAQAALVGFLTRSLPVFDARAGWDVVAIAVGLGVMGLVLCWLWLRAIQGAEWWIDRWHKVLLQIEPIAYEDLKVFRGAVDGTEFDPSRISTKQVAIAVVRLFQVVWGIVIGYGVIITWLWLRAGRL